ncbi:hypothetical protein DFS34DRAFT_576118, partial [Phlyctochytrium arcticum]
RKWFVGKLKQAVGEQFLWHSMRAGGATWMANSGASSAEITVAGHWKSDTFLTYIRQNDAVLEVLYEVARQGRRSDSLDRYH